MSLRDADKALVSSSTYLPAASTTTAPQTFSQVNLFLSYLLMSCNKN